jgi:hypothetical protein
LKKKNANILLVKAQEEAKIFLQTVALELQNGVSSLENEELGEINFHAGVAVSMMWGPDGSGSQTYYIETALEDHFKYSTSTQYVEKNNYSETNWKNLIYAQKNNPL